MPVWYKILNPYVFVIIWALSGCSPNEGQGKLKMDRKSRILHQQYVAKGRSTYMQICANCHQADGNGLGRLYPPLMNSDYMVANIPRTVNIIKNGIKGEIVVNGVSFNQEMPPNPKLTNLEISEITAYIYNRFADSVVLILPNEVEDILGGKQDSW